MQQFHSFIFESYGFDEARGAIELRYSLDEDIHFTETFLLPKNIPLSAPRSAAFDRALFALHLATGISYFKTCLPKEIVVRSGTLTKDQATFWNTVYTQGLGEFFFKNNIDFRGLINFPSGESKNTSSSPPSASRPLRLLVPLGGGKDSIVTVELLRKMNLPTTLLRVGSHPIITELAKELRLPLLTVERKLAPELFKLNADGALNGHVPITTILWFLGTAISELLGYSHVVWSNERSANEGNTELHGMKVNHQWSKSLEAEKMLRQYEERYITQDVRSFSLLRPFSELGIVEMFSHHPEYFSIFSSCNTNWKLTAKHAETSSRWCGNCPKCAFAFVMLAAFLPSKTLIDIFGKNLFMDVALLPTFRELIGLEGCKPFECVGTPEETYGAFLLADERGEWEKTAAMEMFQREALELYPHSDAIVTNALTPSSDHCIPNDFLPLIAP